jgi:ParB-like chromosome segregation protein Spo0J
MSAGGEHHDGAGTIPASGAVVRPADYRLDLCDVDDLDEPTPAGAAAHAANVHEDARDQPSVERSREGRAGEAVAPLVSELFPVELDDDTPASTPAAGPTPTPVAAAGRDVLPPDLEDDDLEDDDPSSATSDEDDAGPTDPGVEPPSGPAGIPATDTAPFNAERPVQLMPLDQVDIPAARHSADELAAISDSIRAVGQLQTVVLRQRGPRFEVVAGRGRVAALSRLGYPSVLARVLADGPQLDDLAALAEIDENICRVKLPAPERDRLVRKRVDILERLHPELSRASAKSRAGKASAAKRRGTPEAASSARSSTAATASATGRSTRCVQLSAARMERAAPEIIAAYERGELKPTQVDELVKLPKDQQARVLDQVRGKSRSETRRVVQRLLHAESAGDAGDRRKLVRGLDAALSTLMETRAAAWQQRDDLAKLPGDSRLRLARRLQKAANELTELADAVRGKP